MAKSKTSGSGTYSPKHHAHYEPVRHSARCSGLASVQIVPPNQGDDRLKLDLRVETRFGETRISDEERLAFTLRVEEALLGLKLNGCTITVGSERLGDQDLPSDIRGKLADRTSRSERLRHGWKAKLLSKVAQIMAGRSVESGVKNETGFSGEVRWKKIIAMAGEWWKFLEPSGGCLEGRYTGGYDEPPLCKVDSKTGSFEITAALYAYPKHVLVTDISPPKMSRKFRDASLEHRRLIEIAIARGLALPGEDKIELAKAAIKTSSLSK